MTNQVIILIQLILYLMYNIFKINNDEEGKGGL